MKKSTTNLLLSVLLTFIANPVLAGELADENQKSSPCAISCSQPMEKTCETIIAVLKATTKAVADKDYVELAKYLDENCTTYDVCTKKTVVGRENIIANVKAKIAAEEKRLKVPAISFTIDQPFAKINGDKAVVTFVLKKEVGGANPAVFESHVTDVFVKRDGEWKKLHYCGGDWKKVK